MARRIRQTPEGHRMTLVALTGYGQDEDRRRAVQAGFNAHLVKPVDVVKLADVMGAAESGRPV